MKKLFLLALVLSFKLQAVGKLANGTPFDCEEDRALIRSTLIYVYPGGGGLVPREYQGAIQIIEELLKEGPSGQTPEAFRELLFGLNSSLSYRGGARSFQWILTSPEDNTAQLLDIAEDLRRKIRWTPEDFNRAKDRVLAKANGMVDDMSSLIRYYAVRDAFRYFPSVLTGEGSPKSVANVTLEKAQELARRLLDRGYLSVYAVTPTSCTVLAAQLEKALNRDKDLPKYLPFTFRPMDPDLYRRKDLQVTVVDKPSATDHQVIYLFPERLAIQGAERLNATVANYILGGGGLTSRLGKELREKRGLTYHAGSSLSPFNPYWGIMTFGGNAQIGPLLVRTPEVVRNFRKEKFKNGEISEIKEQIATDFLAARELTVDRLLERVGDTLYGIAPEFRETYLTTLTKVTPVSVKKFVTDKIHGDGGYLYLMGDKKILLPAIKSAGLPVDKVKVVTVDDVL